MRTRSPMIARFTDDHAGPMVDKETRADLRAGVDIDAGGRVGDFRNDPRQQRQAGAVQVVGQTVVNHRQDPRIAQQHFIHTARGRVAVVSGEYVGVQQASQRRQGQGKTLDQADGVGIDLAVILPALSRGITQLKTRLSEQRIERDVEGMTDVKSSLSSRKSAGPRAHREQRAAQRFEDLCNGFSGRQFASAMLAAQRPLRVRHWSRAPRNWLTMVCNCQ